MKLYITLIIFSFIITSCNKKETVNINYPYQAFLSNNMTLSDLNNDEEIEYHIYNGYYLKNSREFDFIAIQTYYASTEKKADFSQKVFCLQIGLSSIENNCISSLDSLYQVLSRFEDAEDKIIIYKKETIRLVYYQTDNISRIFIFPNPLNSNQILEAISKRIRILYKLI